MHMILSSLLIALAAAGPPPTPDAPFDVRPRRFWDLTHVSIDVALGLDERSVTGRVTHHVSPLWHTAEPLILDAVGLEILDVKVDGEATSDWQRVGSHLHVPLASRQDHEIEIAYRAKPQTGAHFVSKAQGRFKAPQAWTQGQGEDNRHWFPGWDSPNELFTVDIALTVPTGMTAVANGVLQEEEDLTGGLTRWSYRLEQPIVNYLVAFVVGDFDRYDVEGPVPHEIYVPSGVDPSVAPLGANRVPEQMAYMAALLDEPFPYPVYRQAYVMDYLYGGMENATLTTLNADRYVPDAAFEHRTSLDSVAAHELAHQWFGDTVTCKGWRELWLNEGFASYYQGRWFEHDQGELAYAAQVAYWRKYATGTTRPMAARSWAKVGDQPNNAVYVRGASTLHMLRELLGTETYDLAIQTYLDHHRNTLVETADLREALEQASGLELGWFFDTWVHGWGSPTLSSSWSSRDRTTKVKIRQQAKDRAPYLGPVDVVFGFSDGSQREERIWLEAQGATLAIESMKTVDWVAVDARGGLMATWDHQQSTSAWLAQLAEGPAFSRLVAVDALGEGQATPEVLDALENLLTNPTPRRAEPLPTEQPLAVGAADALANLGTTEAIDILVRHLSSDALTPKSRQRLASGLEDMVGNTTAKRALQRALGDRSATVASAALRAYAEHDPVDAAATSRSWLTRRDKSTRQTRWEAALDTLAATGSDADVTRLLALTKDPHPVVQRSAGWALVSIARRLGDDLDDRARRRIALGLAPWLAANDQRTREFGVSLLGRLGAPEGIAPLRALRATTHLDGLDDRIDKAIQSIRSYKPESEDPGAAVRALEELKTLREAFEAATSQLEELSERPPRPADLSDLMDRIEALEAAREVEPDPEAPAE